MTKFYSLTFLLSCFFMQVNAQVVTTSPAVIQENSRDIVITFHADEGNKGLAGLTAKDAVYAHTGVILEGSDTWMYAPSWSANLDKYKMTYVSPDTWSLTIPEISTFYGTKEGEVVERLAFVFRNATGSKEGKTASGGDIFVNVYPADELSMTLTPSVEAGVLSGPTEISFTVNTTSAADIALYANDKEIASVKNSDKLSCDYNIEAMGSTMIKATATAAGKTIESTLVYVRPNAPVAKDYPGGKPQMGAVRAADGTTYFCLAAPGKEKANIVGSWNGYIPSADTFYQDYEGNRYFWWSVSGLKENTDYIYYYIVDTATKVGDPYARLVLDPSNDKYIPSSVYPDMPAYPTAYVTGNVPVAVYNSGADSYDWKVKDFKGVDKDRLVIYELLIRDFTGTEGQAKGNGTIAGVIEKLDYLRNLGVNAIELLPIMEFSGNNSWGYNPNFYFAPDKAYGTPDDYRRLIDEAHERGMAVILDVVFNQTDGLHPWYKMYPASKNPFYNAGAPHSYSVLNDWKQENPLVQQQFKDVLRYWLEAYNVDGFRFDLVKGLGDDNSYGATYNATTNRYTGVTEAKTNAYNASRVARMKELHAAMMEVKPDAYFINENLAGAKEENEMAADGELNWANINNASCQFAMGWPDGCQLNRFYAVNDSRTKGSTVSYAESHDEERMAFKINKWGAAGVKGDTGIAMRRLGSVAAIMLMTPGSHMIWQFQELGADESTKKTDAAGNPTGENSTDPKKVVWSYLNDPDRAGLYETYVHLNSLRNSYPSLFGDNASVTMKCNSASSSKWGTGFTITVTDGNKEMYCVVNPEVSSEMKITVPFKNDASAYHQILASHSTTPLLSGNEVTLAPGAFAIYGTLDISGLDTAVDDIAPAITVKGGAGTITVDGEYDSLQVYTITGMSTSPDNLTPGIYIVVVDGSVYKVAVR